MNADKLVSVSIPSGITTLGEDIFSGCVSLTTVDLGSVTEIRDRAFSGTTALKSIHVPLSVKTIGSDVFDKTAGIEKIFCEAENEPYSWSVSWSYNTELAVYGAK